MILLCSVWVNELAAEVSGTKSEHGLYSSLPGGLVENNETNTHSDTDTAQHSSSSSSEGKKRKEKRREEKGREEKRREGKGREGKRRQLTDKRPGKKQV